MENGKQIRKLLNKHCFRLIAMLTACVMIFVLSGCDSSKSFSRSVSSRPQNTIYPIGKTATLDDIQLTVTNVEKAGNTDWGQLVKKGDMFVVVTVQIKNIGKGKAFYSPEYFQMLNSKRQGSDQAYTSLDWDTTLTMGVLNSGKSITGTMVFEESKNDQSLILQYQDDIHTPDTTLEFKMNPIKNKKVFPPPLPVCGC